MITLDQIVPLLTVDVLDAVKMRIVSVIDLSDNAPIGTRIVRADRDRPLKVAPPAADADISSGRRL